MVSIVLLDARHAVKPGRHQPHTKARDNMNLIFSNVSFLTTVLPWKKINAIEIK